ncbi:MAG TPA: LCP family protein [Thermoleophilia bacterium]|nr:LCP family protein [Thermoleophilia bacterium]
MILWVLLLVLVAVVGVLGWVYGREIVANSAAAVDLAKLSGRVPGWAFFATPVAVLVVIGLVSAYLAYGRHAAVKLIGVVVVVVTLAVPGLALGWANGTVSTVGERTEQVQAAVARTEESLRPALPGEAVSILLIGRDREGEDDPGRSDTQILVRLDPDTKSISMLSVPRDLMVDIPGYGLDKMNAAYSYGGSALVVETFTELTKLPINHFVEVDFAGFWHAVNILGGVYIPVDRRYYNPETSDYKSIDIMPGYQLMRGHDALDFVRFRHDETGDFGRMQRQQLFLREAQRQSSRWSEDWTKVARLIKSITAETTSDIDSLSRLKPLIELVFQVDTSHVSSVHIEGATPTVDGISYVTPTPGEIADAVAEFTQPTEAPVQSGARALTKKMYVVSVNNASGVEGLAAPAVDQLARLGYKAQSGPDAPEFPGTMTVVYAPRSLAAPAKAVAAMFSPSEVRLVDRAPGASSEIRVFVTSSFAGTLIVPETTQQPEQTLMTKQDYDVASWRALAQKTPLRLEMPSAWSPGFTYDQFRAYNITSTEGKRSAAAVASVRTPGAGYWSIQAMRWLDPPAIQNPSGRQTIGDTEYLLFYEGQRLHMVAWRRNKTLYWVLNTLDNELSKGVMLGLATSFKPVR